MATMNVDRLGTDVIRNFQTYLGVPVTGRWDAITEAAFANFQQSRGWNGNYGMTGDINEWDVLVYSLQNPTAKLTAPQALPPVTIDPYADPTRGGTTPTGTGGSGTNSTSARAYISDLLGQWGLGGLTDWAMGQLGDGNVALIPALIRQTDEYKARFSGNEMRRAAGLNVLSEAEYLNLENTYRSIMHSYGIPSGAFDTQSYLAGLIAGDVSPNEVNDRLRIYADAAYNAPTEVRDALQRLYGVSEGGLTAFFMDPERALPLLEAEYKAAGVASASSRAGYGDLSLATSERIASLGGDMNSLSTFSTLNRSQELFSSMTSEVSGPTFSKEQAAIGAFGGDAGTWDVIERRGKERSAAFQGGGSFAENRSGVVGLGSTGG